MSSPDALAKRIEELERAIASLKDQQQDAAGGAEKIGADFQPGINDSKRLAADKLSAGTYLPRHLENPFNVGREAGQALNPMVMGWGPFQGLPAIQSIMRAVAQGTSTAYHLLDEVPGTYLTVSFLYDVLRATEEYLELTDEDGSGGVPETIIVERDDLLAIHNTLNALLCLNTPLLREKCLQAERIDPATTKARKEEVTMTQTLLREERHRRAQAELPVDTLTAEASSKMAENLATKQMVHFAKMLAQSLPLMEKGESSGSGKKSPQMSNKERQELKELRKFHKRHQSNKKGGKNEDE